DIAAPAAHRVGYAGIGDGFDAPAHLEHRRVLYPPEVVRRGEGHGAVDQHDREEVLQRDVGHLALVHDLEHLLREPDHDPLDLIGLDPVLPDELVEDVHGALYRTADRPALDAAAHDLVGAAQSAHQRFRIGLRRHDKEEMGIARIDILDAG